MHKSSQEVSKKKIYYTIIKKIYSESPPPKYIFFRVYFLTFLPPPPQKINFLGRNLKNHFFRRKLKINFLGGNLKIKFLGGNLKNIFWGKYLPSPNSFSSILMPSTLFKNSYKVSGSSMQLFCFQQRKQRICNTQKHCKNDKTNWFLSENFYYFFKKFSKIVYIFFQLKKNILQISPPPKKR